MGGFKANLIAALSSGQLNWSVECKMKWWFGRCTNNLTGRSEKDCPVANSSALTDRQLSPNPNRLATSALYISTDVDHVGWSAR